MTQKRSDSTVLYPIHLSLSEYEAIWLCDLLTWSIRKYDSLNIPNKAANRIEQQILAALDYYETDEKPFLKDYPQRKGP